MKVCENQWITFLLYSFILPPAELQPCQTGVCQQTQRNAQYIYLASLCTNSQLKRNWPCAATPQAFLVSTSSSCKIMLAREYIFYLVFNHVLYGCPQKGGENMIAKAFKHERSGHSLGRRGSRSRSQRIVMVNLKDTT